MSGEVPRQTGTGHRHQGMEAGAGGETVNLFRPQSNWDILGGGGLGKSLQCSVFQLVFKTFSDLIC